MEDEEVKKEREREEIKKQGNKLSRKSNQIKSNDAADPPFGCSPFFFLFSGSLPLCHVVFTVGGLNETGVTHGAILKQSAHCLMLEVDHPN